MKTKKILSLLVAMTMLLSCVGISAMAEETAPIVVTFTDGYTKEFDSLSQAMRYGYSGGDIEKITVYEDITETITYLEGNIVSGNPDGVTITNTITEADGYYIYCDSANFTIGEGVTFNAPTGGLFVYGNDCVINGRVTVATYYQRYSGTKLTINEPGNLTVTGDGTILRYMDSDPNAGIYINGDNNDETVGLNAAVIYFYQGMINAKDANIKVGTYWQRNTVDENQGSANLVLDNTKMSVTVNEHNFEATGNSTVTLTNNSKLTIAGGHQFGENAVVAADATSSIADKNGNIEVASPVTYVAQVGGTKYETIEEAFRAATEGCTIDILGDVVIDDKWDCRDYATNGSHSRFNESVTINGNNHTIKFTGEVKDNNWNTIFRFEENATVKNLTVDISEATGAQRVITAKKSLNVDKLTIVGSAKYGIIFGEGASAEDLAKAEISIANSNLNGTRRAISDNEGGEDVKSVTITGNTLNANVAVSASEAVTFTGNTVNNGYVNIKSYTADNTCNVTATENTLDLTKGEDNKIDVGGTINAQKEFIIPAKGSNSYAYTGEVDGYVRVWGEGGGNAKESFVLKLYSEDTLMATTQLNNIGGIIDSDVYVTWTFFYPESNDPYWTTTWEEGHPNALDKPTKVELYIDGTLVSTTAAQMNGPDNLNPVIWEELGGVQAPELPTATVTEIKNDELTFALNFKADDASEAQLAYYGDWFADYVLTVNKDVTFNANGGADGYLSGQYDAWSENWVNVPFEDVTLKANEPIKIMEYAAYIMGQSGLKLTYNDVYGFVKDFNCGVFFEEEFLAKNPDFEVTLELRMYNPKDESESYVIGETYTFEAPEVETPVAAIGEKKYSTLQEALADAKEGDTITLLDNISLDESVVVTKELTLDLAGKTITGTDNNTSGNFYLINVNKGALTVDDSIGGGKITLTATNERNWTASSVVIANNQGTLIVEDGTIEHLGGTSMAYGIDTLTNGTIGDVTTTINGGSVDSTYFAIRQFANSTTKMNTVEITGGDIGYVWMQSPNDQVNTVTTTISGGMVDGLCVSGVNADYTLSALASSLGESKVYGTMPAGKKLTETNGTYSLTDEAPEVEKFDFYGSAPVLENSLAMQFAIAKTHINGTGYYAEITHYKESGAEVITVPFEEWLDEEGIYIIEYSGIFAKQIGDVIEVVIYDENGKQVSVKRVDGLKEYALRMLSKADSSANLKTALVDMLNYGAAAQIQFNYKVNTLANNGIDDYKHYASTTLPTLENKREMDSAVCYGTTLELEENIELLAAFTGITQGMYATISFTDHYGNEKVKTVNYDEMEQSNGFQIITVDNLVVADADVLVTITVYNTNGTVYTTFKDSINGYLARNIDRDADSKIYETIAKFTASAHKALH